ncbi:MAG: DUF2784 domain-containing protein [Fimbriimonas sp.]
MPLWLLHVLNVLFLVLHTGLIVFNLVGWAWRRTRRWHLATLAMTAASWFLLAPWYGVGYCLCTDWHWGIRRQLGIEDAERGYVQFLVRVLTGWQPEADLVRTVTGSVFFVAVGLSIGLNLRDRLRLAAERKEADLRRTRPA